MGIRCPGDRGPQRGLREQQCWEGWASGALQGLPRWAGGVPTSQRSSRSSREVFSTWRGRNVSPWPLKLLLPKAESLHRGPPPTSRPASGLNPQVFQSPGQGLLLRCHQEILFSRDIFSRKRAGSKCHVSRLLSHCNFGLFKETVITLLPPRSGIGAIRTPSA